MFFSIQLSVSFLYSVFNEHSPLSSPRSYLSVFPNSQTTSFANLFYFCVVKGGLAADTPFESDDNQFCQLLFDLAKSKVYWPPVLPAGGLKWTRTTDLPLIRRVL